MNRLLLTLILPAIAVLGSVALLNGMAVDAAPNSEPIEARKESTEAQVEEAIEEERAARDARRAFYTAPPVIPHDVVPNQARQCQFCHEEVRETPFGVSIKTPHPQFTNCFQCHVAQKTTLEPNPEPVATTFKGLLEPKDGSRNNPVAPPTIPHRLFLRENCLSCHDSKNPRLGMRTPHPQRSQCVQCHVPEMDAEFTL